MKKYVLTAVGIIALALLLVGCATAPTAAAPKAAAPKTAAIVKEDIVGHWEGDWGTMYLKVVGSQVRGVYTYEDGRVVGTFANGVFQGWWSETPGRESPDSAGLVEFKFLREAGQALALDGRWKYGDDPAEEWQEDWDLQRVGGDIPADIEPLFEQDEDFVEG